MPGPNSASSAAPDLHALPFLRGLIMNVSTINLKYYFLQCTKVLQMRRAGKDKEFCIHYRLWMVGRG